MYTASLATHQMPASRISQLVATGNISKQGQMLKDGGQDQLRATSLMQHLGNDQDILPASLRTLVACSAVVSVRGKRHFL